MNDCSRLSLDIADLPLMPFGMKSPLTRREGDRTAPKFKKLSRNRVTSPITDSRSGVNIHFTEPKSDEENVSPGSNQTRRRKDPLASKHPAPKISSMLRKPTFFMKINSKMPALIEEDSDDVFIVPAVPTSVPRRKPPQVPPLTPLQAPSVSPRGSALVRTPFRLPGTSASAPTHSNIPGTSPNSETTSSCSHIVSTQKAVSVKSRREPVFDITAISSIGPVRGNEVMCSTRLDERRESVMTDIDEGPFVEYTSLHPEGRVIPHNDSLDAVKNNLYFTCDSQPNETKYSTSSKHVNARYGFHKLVDAIKKQRMLSQISKDVCLNSDASEPAEMLPDREALITEESVNDVASPRLANVLSSTMIDNRPLSQYPLNTPDVSSITLSNGTSVDDSIPLASQYVRSINPSTPCFPFQAVPHSHNIVPAPKSNNDDAVTSIISEDVSLAASLKSSLRIFDNLQQPLPVHKTDCPPTAVNRPASKSKVPISDCVPSSSKQPKKNPSNNNLRSQVPAKVVSLDESGNLSSDESIEEVYHSRPRFTEFSHMTQTPRKLMPGAMPSRVVNSNATFKAHNAGALIHRTNDPPCVAIVNKKTVPAAPLPITPNAMKPSVCQWIMNSPFKDGSFDSSFLRHGGSSTGSEAGIVKTTVAETSSDDDDMLPEGDGMPKMRTNTDHTSKKRIPAKRTTEECQEEKLGRVPGGESSDSPPENFDENADCSIHSESLRLRLEASSRTIKTTLTIGRVAKSPPAPALRSVFLTSSDLVNNVSSTLGGRTEVSKKEPSRMHKITTTAGDASQRVDTPDRDQAVSVQPDPVSDGRKSIADLADSDSSDHSLPNGTPCATTVTKRKAITRQQKSKLIDRASGILDADTKNVPLRTGNNDRVMNLLSEKDKENQCASPLLRTNLTKGAGALINTKIKVKANPPRTVARKLPLSDSSNSDELSNYMNKWKKTHQDTITSDGSISSDADSDSSFIVVTSDEDDDDMTFYLPSLTKGLVKGKKKFTSRQDLGSISEELPTNKNSKLPSTTSSTKKNPVIHELSDSTDSVSSPEQAITCRPRKQVVMSDSDDDTYTPPSQTKGLMTPVTNPPNVMGLFTPLPAKTSKPGPRKTLVCPQTVEPSKSRVPSKVTCTTVTMNCATPTLSFLASLSAHPGNDRLHPEAVPYLKSFKQNRENLVNKLYKLFNSQCFDDKLPDTMNITWNVRLTKTAGYCYYQVDRSKPSGRGARVELSTKVVDSCERVRDTLIHELCHAISWIVSGYKDGHGPLFKSWASKARNRFPELPAINRCHNYQISCKFTYRCIKCNYSIGRHSKSLDITRKVCGRCRGSFELLVNGKSARQGAEGVPRTPRTPAPFALFVKKNYGSVKKSASALKHADVMKILGEQFKEMKT